MKAIAEEDKLAEESKKCIQADIFRNKSLAAHALNVEKKTLCAAVSGEQNNQDEWHYVFLAYHYD